MNTLDQELAARPPRRRWHDLGTRAASGVVLVVLALGSTKIGGAVFLAFWLASAVAMLWEWQTLSGGGWSSARLLIGAGALLGVALLAARTELWDASLVVLVAGVAVTLLAGPGRRIWAAGGLVYATLFILSLVALRFSFPFGARSIFWLFAVVWSTDVFAYFGGRLIGGPKLWPRVSPSKTWSGTVSGVLAGAACGTAVALADPQATARSLLPVVLLSAAASILSQGGDAFESAVKRRFGVKDASRLIPGHGGVLDRLDGFVAATVFAFLVGLVRNLPSIAGGLFFWV